MDRGLKSRERRLPLSRARILAAALALVDESGLAELSMRRLAQGMGFEAMSLYKHVKDKDDIVAGIVDLVVAEIELPPSTPDWERAIRTCALSAHDTLLRHPWAAALVLSPDTRSPGPSARLRYIDWILGVLQEAGFSDDLVYHGYHAVDSHILGYTLWQLGHSAGSADLETLAATLLQELRTDDFPHLATHVEAHLRHRAETASTGFEFGLDLILEGLKRRLTSARHRSGTQGG